MIIKSILDRIWRPKKDKAEAWNDKGLALSNQHKHKEAIKAYDMAIEIEPKHIEAWCNKGSAFYELGLIKDAINAYNTAIDIDPKCARAWYSKGNILVDQGKYEDATKCYNKSIEITPKNAKASQDKSDYKQKSSKQILGSLPLTHIDLRSKKELYLELKAEIELNDEDENISKKLLNLQLKGGFANEAIREEIKQIGKYLCQNGGDDRMVLIAYRVKALGGNGHDLERCWNGICGWME